ncbi:MAG: hypothetical protein MUF15_10145 [Acidobacteria bacterium]|jgi:hypothetical protein|nr:hypothetical protein [Acidobacteriota bacterium]
MELTKGLAFDALQKIFKKKFLLIIGTGASCALDHRFGMPALAKELKEKIPGEIWAIYQDKTGESNAIIKNGQYNNPLIINKSIWQIDKFAKEVLLGE